MFELKSTLIQSSKSHSFFRSFSLVMTLNHKQVSENFIHDELHDAQGERGRGRGRLCVLQASEPCRLRKPAAERKTRTQGKWETVLRHTTPAGETRLPCWRPRSMQGRGSVKARIRGNGPARDGRLLRSQASPVVIRPEQDTHTEHNTQDQRSPQPPRQLEAKGAQCPIASVSTGDTREVPQCGGNSGRK